MLEEILTGSLAIQPFRMERLAFVSSVPAPTLSAASIGSMGMSAFSGLGGYMTLGLGAKAKPNALRVTETEFLIAKERE